MSGSQTAQGKAFEYACALAFEQNNDPSFTRTNDNEPFKTAKECFNTLAEDKKNDMAQAASSAYYALVKLEPNLSINNPEDAVCISIQEDSKGIGGDVRDVVIRRERDAWEIGLSCKHNHSAVKHSRLSDTIDFGQEWLGFPCSDEYWSAVKPLFQELRKIRESSGKTAVWGDDKADRYYVPILNAFIAELKRLDKNHPGEVPRRLVHYLIGKNDFYKVITNDEGRYDTIEAMNLEGTLNNAGASGPARVRIPKMKLPQALYHVGFIPDSKNTILVVCDAGWQISMRIHNASSKVEPSLKFDVQLVSLPHSVYSETVLW